MFKKILVAVFSLFPFILNAGYTNAEWSELPGEDTVYIKVDGELYKVVNKEQVKKILDSAELEEVDEKNMCDGSVQMASSYLTESNDDRRR